MTGKKRKRIPPGFGERMKKLRGEMSQAEFGKRIGATSGHISPWENELSFPSAQYLSAMIREFDVSINWLLRGIGPMTLKGWDDLIANLPDPHEAGRAERAADGPARYSTAPKHAPGSIRLPVFGYGAAADSSGRVQLTADESVEEVVELRDLRVWRVRGDSMMPVALDGQGVVFSEDPPRNRGLAIVDVTHRGILLKRWLPEGDHVTLVSVNPMPAPENDPIRVPMKRVRWAFRVVGVLLE